MKAIVFDRYGPPDVVRLADVEAPTPAPGEVLVQVRAASVNPADWHAVRGEPFLARLEFGPRRPRPERRILGSDVAGTVVALGTGSTRFRPGDDVFGTTFTSGWRGFAEYVAVPEAMLARTPPGLPFDEAAAAPLAASTALQALHDRGRVRPGLAVLINGASGGVGTFAVQLAKVRGAQVTGVCSAGNHAMVQALGADRTIDYTRDDFANGQSHYDLIVCAVGDRSAAEYARALKPGGRCVVVGFTTLSHLLREAILAGGWRSLIGSRKIRSMGTVSPDTATLEQIRTHLDAGDVRSTIDRRYELHEAAAALRYVEQGHARGKVVLVVS